MGTSSQPTGRHNGGKRALLDDDYMMTTYKVIPCSRVSTHNWKLCHFSHVGETAARRRHPSCHQADLCTYVSANKECPDGDKCPYAHNAFESWLHPDRYKTTLCSYAGACTRKFCFFAHSPHELRHPTKQHPASAANPQLRLAKTASLDTSPSVGTPNSSSSNMSSSSAQAMQAAWGAGSPMAVSVGNSVAAAAAAAAGMYVQQMQPMAGGTAVGIPVSSSLAGNNMYLPMYQATGHQQQQQLMTAFIDSSSCHGSLLAHPPGLSTILVAAPQLTASGNAAAAAAAAAPMQMQAGGFSGGAAGMQLGWDSLTLARFASVGAPMATDGSQFGSNSLQLFDPASPSTPLTVASVSPMHSSPMMALHANMPANSAGGIGGGLQQGSLQHALQGSSQQQLQQQQQHQLLLRMMNAQQQKQAQPPQQDATIDADSTWSLSAVDANVAMMLQLNQQQQPAQQSNLSAATGWPQFTLQQQQQQQQDETFSGMDVQVLPGPQGFLPVVQGSAGQHDLGCSLTGAAAAAASASEAAANDSSSGNSGNGFASAGPEATQQLQQQLNLLSFAMAQPA